MNCGCPSGMCPCGGGGCASGPCPIMMIILCLVWFLVSSGLLYYTWNKVITYLFNAKSVKFWQALLIVLTLGFMASPKLMMHKPAKWGKSHCQTKECGKNCPMSMQKGMGNDQGAPPPMPTDEHP